MASTKTEKSEKVEDELPLEASLAKLEKLVEDLEGGKLDLDTAFSRFEDAVTVSKALRRRLDAYERKLEKITGMGADGKPITEPLADAPGEG